MRGESVPLDNSRYNEYYEFAGQTYMEDSMVQIIRSADRHHLDAGWLSTHWHFSFDDYYDPANISFGPLRVFNDDVIKPAGGFPMHPHKEMEIVTYVIDGTLEHSDSMGNKGQIKPGEIQRMSAGTGLRHSEYNASKTDPLHLVQLWIIPAKQRLTPSWEQKQFSVEARSGKLAADCRAGRRESRRRSFHSSGRHNLHVAPGRTARPRSTRSTPVDAHISSW